jgi:hypothetical protein
MAFNYNPILALIAGAGQGTQQVDQLHRLEADQRMRDAETSGGEVGRTSMTR